MGIPEELKPKADKEITEKHVLSPLAGEVEELSDVNDVVFSQGMLGKGAAVFPTDGKIYAPFDAKVRVFNTDTKHAIGLASTDGVELLIHCGLDTVKLDGKGFTSHIKQDQEVKKGDLMLEFDPEFISQQGYDPTTMVLVTNVNDFNEIKPVKLGEIKSLDILLNLQ